MDAEFKYGFITLGSGIVYEPERAQLKEETSFIVRSSVLWSTEEVKNPIQSIVSFLVEKSSLKYGSE